jgi:hypothetical protein
MIYSILLIPFVIQLFCPEKMLDFTEWWYEKKGMSIDRSHWLWQAKTQRFFACIGLIIVIFIIIVNELNL